MYGRQCGTGEWAEIWIWRFGTFSLIIVGAEGSGCDDRLNGVDGSRRGQWQ